jgi:hypothetical protein
MLTGCMDPKDTWNLQKENLLTIAVFSKTWRCNSFLRSWRKTLHQENILLNRGIWLMFPVTNISQF